MAEASGSAVLAQRLLWIPATPAMTTGGVTRIGLHIILLPKLAR